MNPSSSSANFPVIVASVFGRGYWLAESLKAEGIPVLFLDFTHFFSEAQSKYKSPFGLLFGSKLSDSQKQALSLMGSVEHVESGINLWTEKGPISWDHSLTGYSRKLNSSPEAVIDGQAWNGMTAKEKSLFLVRQSQSSKQNTWLMKWAFQLQSSKDLNSEDLSSTWLPELNSSFSLFNRGVSSQVTNDKLREMGIEVLTPKKAIDYAHTGKTHTLELDEVSRGLFECEHLLWCLDESETETVSHVIRKKLYSSDAAVTAPSWNWTPFKLEIKFSNKTYFPKMIVALKSWDLPWSHQNQVILNHEAENQYLAWIKIPSAYLGHHDYQIRKIQESYQFLCDLWPTASIRVLELDSEVAALRFPVWPSSAKIRKNKTHLHQLAPTLLNSYDWNEFFQEAEVIHKSVSHWWRQKLIKEEKRNRK